MKKLFATFLALVMVLSSLCLPAVANQTTPANADVTLTQADFVADADDYDEDENTTEMLARAKIEKAIATKTNAVILLGADITVDVSSTTVFPLLADNFYGSFYGDGHTITLRDATDTTKDATIALAFNTDATSRGVLFDTVGINISDDKDTTEVNEEWKSDALIYDLTVKGVNATVSDGTAKGSQFGTIAGSTQRVLTMNNVHVEGTLTKSSTAATNVGGLLGKANNTTYIYDCSFNGNITYTGTSDCTAGGIVGAVVNTTTIESCTVNNNNQTDGKIAGSSRAGGLVGVINIGVDKTAVITKKTEVYGTVTSPIIAGGLIGGVEGNGVLNMSRSGTNYAPTNYATVTSAARAGGIIGRVYSGGDAAITPRITMNFVSNQGAVTGTGNDAGGMIGLVQKVSLATGGDYNIRIYNNSSNTGAVTGCNFVGGVIGRVKASGAVVRIENTTNTGSVKATAAFAGGIVGMSDGTDDTLIITNTANLGNVSGKNYAGGILGHHRTNPAKSIAITGCVNMGAISTSSDQQPTTVAYAGGIVGGTAKASTSFKISDCLNFGTVSNTETSTNVGGIYGTLKDTAPTPTDNNTDFTATNAGTTAVANSALIAMGEEGKAQMRYSNTPTDAGIRFKIDTNSALLTALTNAGYTYTLGSLMATKATATEAGALTKAALEGKLHSDVNTGAVVKDNQYAVAINKIGADYYATEFQCAGYITLTKGDLTFTIYTEASEARSVAYIADAILDANTETAAIEKYRTTLEIFAAALSE